MLRMVQVPLGALVLWYCWMVVMVWWAANGVVKMKYPFAFKRRSYRILFAASCFLWPVTWIPLAVVWWVCFTVKMVFDFFQWIWNGSKA